MELQTRMRDLLHCVSTVTIWLVAKALTPLWSIHFVQSVVLPVRTHQHHNNRANPLTTNTIQCLGPHKFAAINILEQ